VINSGCSNVALGEQGIADAREMTRLAAARVGVPEHETFVASTGVIGRRLPMDKLQHALAEIEVSREGGDIFARAMMTTDTFAKNRALTLEVGGRNYVIGGAAKGAGMAHPDMATVLCFLTTDAPVEAGWLQQVLREVGDQTINMIDVDMDVSTSDSMLVFANGAAGGERLTAAHPAAAAFKAALLQLSTALARDLARDGEGARTLIEVVVSGAKSLNDARIAARTIASSPLVKTMVTGRDPNPGRILMAVGRSGAEVAEERISVWIGAENAFLSGVPSDVPYSRLKDAMMHDEVRLKVDLGLGDQIATAWGCDLTEDYVRINASYTT
jgi:glutamate N-acetyltransferase/amino-acid N-acetyltransferase